MHIEYVPNRNSRPTILLRQSYREGKLVRKRTLVNLTNWSTDIIESMKRLLKGEVLLTGIESLKDAFKIIRSRAYGNIFAVLGTLKKIGLDQLISSKPSKNLNLVCAMIVTILIPVENDKIKGFVDFLPLRVYGAWNLA